MTLQEFTARAFQLTHIEEARHGWYHFEGRIPEVTQGSVEYLRSNQMQRGFKISVELEKPEREYMTLVTQHADAVFYSKLWAEVSALNQSNGNHMSPLRAVQRDVAHFSIFKLDSPGSDRLLDKWLP